MGDVSRERRILESNLKTITNLINKVKDPFRKFEILNTFVVVLSDPVLSNFAAQKDFNSAMAYMAKVCPPRPVPGYIQVLSKCNLIVQETDKEIRLVNKKEKKVTHVIKNDPIGSGRSVLKVATTLYAQEVDKVEYYVDFNAEERRRDVERHTKGEITYEDYKQYKTEATQLPDYEVVNFFDDNFELQVVPDRNLKSSAPLDHQSVEEAYERFRRTPFAMSCVTRSPEKLSFPLDGHVLVAVGRVAHFVPVKDMCNLVKGPEFDEIVDETLAAIRREAEHEGLIGARDYEPAETHRESMKLMGQEFMEVVHLRENFSPDSNEDIMKEMGGDVKLISKYRSVKNDFENQRSNLQVNRDKYEPMMEHGFVEPKSYKTRITALRQSLANLTFDEMLWDGAREIKKYLSTTAYAQSIAASQGRKSFADSDMKTCLSLFLDGLIKSPGNFPEMQYCPDGKKRFLVGSKVVMQDPSRDALERYNNSKTEPVEPKEDLVQARLDADKAAEEKARQQYKALRLARDGKQDADEI